jgi:hypothetical protein
MKNKNFVVLIISLGGLLFSGFLSWKSLIAGVCPLNEGCPSIGGLPACVYGFGIFALIFLIAFIGLINKTFKPDKIKSWLMIISGGGAIFSLYSIYLEMFVLCQSNCRYSLILPTCVYGLLMYVAVFLVEASGNKE